MEKFAPVYFNLILWCHVRHIDPIKMHPERITQKDKELVNPSKKNAEILKQYSRGIPLAFQR